MSKEPQCSDAGPQSTVQDDQTQTEDDQLSISEVHRSFENMLSTQDEAELRRIATEVSIDLDTHGAPQLDPNSKEFDLNKWLSLFVRNANDSGIKMRRAGVCFRDLTVSGSGPALGIQETVLSSILAPLRRHESLRSRKGKKILNDFNGVLREGELLVVLGRPGSGCSTFLKSICGELHGLTLDKASVIHYNGIPQDQMLKEFKGEVIYNQEVDKHFPHLTVGQTLEFAASARAPSQRQRSLSRSEWVKIMTSVVMATFGLRHTYNTKVGSDFVRGVSGGERKRVSIAEMALAAAPLASWDNSTRGLDSATALEFIKSLRLASKLTGSTHSVAIYQASQSIYDQFDKATVLYEGRQIFFGRAQDAKKFFEDQGWYCPPRQTTGDFLTSVTNPVERRPRLGMEKKVPRTPEEFEQYWRKSSAFRDLQVDQDEYDKEYPVDGTMRLHFQESKRDQQARHTNPNSSYLLSIPMQVRLNTKRAYQRIWNDITSTVTTVVSQVVMALIIGSVFYGTPDATQGFASKNATLFFAILLNALIAISEINSLYAQRPIIEKHHSYAFYHPFTEAVAGIVADIPVKFCLAVAFNIILYFMTNLDRTPGKFFLYFLIVFISMFVMSAVFRTLAAITKGISQAMALAGVVVLALAVYTGFVIPVPYMHPWFKWIHYINPIFYAFEILMANEYHGRHFTCSGFIPPYPVLEGDSFVCSSNGAIAGQRTVLGDNYIATFGYSYSHVWRNFGILCAFLCGFMAIYFIATEVNSSTTSTAEVLVFQRGRVPAQVKNDNRVSDDEEFSAPTGTMQLENAGDDTDTIPAQTSIFTWKDVVYDIRIKDEQRRLLDHVSGWVKPGTLTALMGASGAGKTTLLDVLAQRASIGVITGEMFVNGMPLDQSFQRNTGYVQQQDLHLQTSTVRESLQFSAMLRQPDTVSKAEKYAHVESVIRMLGMESFADAVVGIPGQGLNVEQRKLLSIGVELAAKPKLLIFLDEPTSGLDSQSSWSICAFLRKLADSGQAILCTIHQPSATLFEQFDRLLFLAKGGKTVYFGDIGKHSRTLLGYFESNGARQCRDDENPAEYILEIVETTVDGKDWNATWKESEECLAVYEEIDRIHQSAQMHAAEDESTVQTASEFATPFWQQLCLVSQRVFQQYWRMPYYIWAKLGLGMSSGLFIGFSAYNSPNSLQGMQNVIFSVFMVTTIFSVLVQQIMPLFITQRSLYEVRERASKMYSWKAFLIANISVEIPYQIFLGILVFGCYYYAVNGIQSSARQGLVLLYCIQFFIFGSSFAHMLVAGLPDAETAGAVTTLLFSLILVFNGVMQVPSALPGFWIFMYRVSPFTYWVAGIVGTILHDRPVQCSSAEFSVFNPPSNQTCGEYLGEFLKVAPGYLDNPTATAGCQYCSLRVSDQYLAGSEIYWTDRGRNFGLGWAYIFFNIFMAVVLYWALRVKRWSLPGLKKFQRPRTPTTAKRSNKKEESF